MLGGVGTGMDGDSCRPPCAMPTLHPLHVPSMPTKGPSEVTNSLLEPAVGADMQSLDWRRIQRRQKDLLPLRGHTPEGWQLTAHCPFP